MNNIYKIYYFFNSKKLTLTLKFRCLFVFKEASGELIEQGLKELKFGPESSRFFFYLHGVGGASVVIANPKRGF